MQNHSEVDVSVVMINYNNSKLSIDCIHSIQKFTKNLSFEIILIDNNSESEELALLKKSIASFTDVKVIYSKFNLGFGAGNNLGFQHATGKYTAFVNNDVLFIENCLYELFKFMESHNDVGCVTPRQLNSNHEQVPAFNHLESITKEIIGKKALEKLCKKKYPKRKNTVYSTPLEVTVISGAFMFMPSDLFQNIGGFDPALFLYYEEEDVYYRIKKRGYRSFYYPKVSFVHLHGATADMRSITMSKELLISKMYNFKKHHRYSSYLLMTTIQLVKHLFSQKKWFGILVILRGISIDKSIRPPAQ